MDNFGLWITFALPLPITTGFVSRHAASSHAAAAVGCFLTKGRKPGEGRTRLFFAPAPTREVVGYAWVPSLIYLEFLQRAADHGKVAALVADGFVTHMGHRQSLLSRAREA